MKTPFRILLWSLIVSLALVELALFVFNVRHPEMTQMQVLMSPRRVIQEVALLLKLKEVR